MKLNRTIIINLFSGPGAGKSTTAAGVFHKLKLAGVNCELVTEYAKDVVWKENFNTLKNQLYIFAKQHNKIFHLKDKVKVIVTDSPIILSLVYYDESKVSKHFSGLVLDEFNDGKFINFNYYLNRVKPYNPKGRFQNENEAKEVDTVVFNMLQKYNIGFKEIQGDESAVNEIVNDVLGLLRS